jgi:aminomethyltransferase
MLIHGGVASAQLEVSGGGAEVFLESVMVADLQALNMNTGTLSVLTSGNGGIIDDLIVARTGEESFYVVANAGCADKDLLHLRACQDRFSEGGSSVCLSVLDDRSLIAYQAGSEWGRG